MVRFEVRVTNLLMETQLEEDESFWNDQSNNEMFTNSIRRPAPTRKDAIKKRALKQRVLKKKKKNDDDDDDDGGGNEDEDDTMTEAAPPKKLPTGTGVWGI